MSQLDFIVKKVDEIAGSVAIINDEIGVLTVRIAVLENQVADILWLQRLLVGTIIVAIVGAILGLILKKKQ